MATTESDIQFLHDHVERAKRNSRNFSSNPSKQPGPDKALLIAGELLGVFEKQAGEFQRQLALGARAARKFPVGEINALSLVYYDFCRQFALDPDLHTVPAQVDRVDEIKVETHDERSRRWPRLLGGRG